MHRADVLRDLAYPNTVTGKAPQQRPWQGLTDEDVNRESAPITSQMKLAFHAGMYVAQKILKERNTPDEVQQAIQDLLKNGTGVLLGGG
jgi:hypothetical protein